MKPGRDLTLGLSALVLLLGLCVLGWYFGSTPLHRRLDAQSLLHTIDMKMTKVHLEQYDEKGVLAKRLVSNEITHIPQDNTFFLTAPNLDFQSNDSPDLWHLTAKQAKTHHGTESILFKQDVILNQPGTTLKTQTLHYQPKQNQATTEEGVTFDQGLTHFIADKTRTVVDKNNHPTYAIATTPAPKRVHFWTTRDDKLFHAYANQIEYFPEQQLITLTGNAEVQQDKHHFTAPIIRYNLAKHQVITESNQDTRTRILFYPDKKNHA